MPLRIPLAALTIEVYSESAEDVIDWADYTDYAPIADLTITVPNAKIDDILIISFDSNPQPWRGRAGYIKLVANDTDLGTPLIMQYFNETLEYNERVTMTRHYKVVATGNQTIEVHVEDLHHLWNRNLTVQHFKL